MKAYLVTTGALFGLVAVAHLARTIAEWQRLGTDPWFLLEGPGLGLAAATLALWAWRQWQRLSAAGAASIPPDVP